MSTDETEEGEILEDGEIADDDNDNHIRDFDEGSKENDLIMNNGGGGGIIINRFGPPPPPTTTQPSLHQQFSGNFDSRDEKFFPAPLPPKGPPPPQAKRGKKRGDRGNRKRKRINNIMDNNNVLSGMNKQRKFSPPTHQLQQQQQQSSLLNEPSSSSSLSTTNSIQPSSSPTSSTMTTTIVATNSNQRDTFDITQYLNDSSFDAVELSDEIEFRFELIEFDVFMEILGCKINEESDLFKNGNIPQQQQQERSKLMSRIVKIMKKLHGNDPDTARRFARLKRRSKEKQNSTDNESKTGVFKTPCRFYIEGKCHKGSDCLYSHDVSIPKRKELCKFYLQGFCGKGDDCLFMHSEFPCKFFHTNTKCYAGENCRFSHQTLTDEMREILRSYLDSGTFPDEVKPYWPINNPNDWIKDVDDPDSNDYDYDALLSNKTRKVLLGPPNEKMKNSLETWKWQQELKESEQSYTGAKRNLFSIDDGLVLKEKPPTPRLEEDDEVIEAHIQSYYNDLLDTDDYDEMIHLKEIEELEQKLKQEEEIRKQQSILDPPPPSTTTEFPNPTIVSDSSTLQQQSSTTEELSEEEKRLIEASMKDEDLRILPNQPFVLPAAFGGPPTTPIPMAQPSTVLDVNQTTPPYVSNFNSPHHNPFGLPQPLLDGGGQPVLDSKPFGINNNIDPSPQSMLPVQTQQPSQDPRTRDPRIRDPRLNNSNRLVPNVVTTTATTSVTNVSSNSNISGGGPSPSISTQSTVLSTTVNSIKPENKVIKSNTQNLVIKYKLIGVEVNAIDYSVYYESYQVDNSLRCDPRLKRFFDNLSSSSPRINTNFTNTVDQSTDQVQESNFPKSSTESFMMTGQKKSSPSQSVIITKPQPLSLSSQSSLPSSSSSNIIISRDPRMRNRINDNDLRNSLDTKNSDSNTSIISTNSTDQTITTTTSPLSLTTNTLTTSVVENSEMNTSTKSKNNSTVVVSDQNTQNNLTEIINCKNNDRSSIPSYALSALLPTTQSLFSSVTGNSLLPFNKTSTNTESLLLIDSNNINNDDDDDDDDDEEDQLKVDENPIDSTLINDGESSSNETKLWPKISIGNNLINNDVTNTTTTKTLSVIDSSDNEMEIDLRISSTSTNLFDKNNALNSNLINVHQPPSLSSSKSQLSSLTSTTIEAAIKNQDDNQNNSSNNESESEYENELIIATSSSEQEDNLLLSNSSSLLNNNNNNNIDEQQLQKQQQQNNIVSSCGDL